MHPPPLRGALALVARDTYLFGHILHDFGDLRDPNESKCIYAFSGPFDVSFDSSLGLQKAHRCFHCVAVRFVARGNQRKRTLCLKAVHPIYSPLLPRVLVIDGSPQQVSCSLLRGNHDRHASFRLRHWCRFQVEDRKVRLKIADYSVTQASLEHAPRKRLFREVGGIFLTCS